MIKVIVRVQVIDGNDVQFDHQKEDTIDTEKYKVFNVPLVAQCIFLDIQNDLGDKF